MLTNSLKISDTTKTELFKVILFVNHQRIREKYYRVDLSSVSGPFPMLTVHKCSDTELFKHLSNQVFCSV